MTDHGTAGAQQPTGHLARIVEIVSTVGTISGFGPDADFYEAGFASINALQLLMDLEDAFGVTIPDDEFVAARSCTALGAMIERLLAGAPR